MIKLTVDKTAMAKGRLVETTPIKSTTVKLDGI